MNPPFLILLLLTCLIPAMKTQSLDASQEPDFSHGRDMMLRAFEREVEQIEGRWFEGVETLEDWEARRSQLRQQVAEMLGLWPEPKRADLKATITGIVEHEDFTVHNLHFQSMPGLYVTANYYVPKSINGKAPVVLYLCGHARRVEDGISYGPKAAYQHHPAWYARHGIASLIIDTLNNGEIQGQHHGTHNQGRWWWYNRGYTPAGIEAWNAIRALDFLETRKEVDMDRVGATGRSGGGMYSWFLLALDDRVSVATPTAGLTDLRNHVVDEAIRGHCDCNYWNNYHRLDTAVLAALAAPRAVRLVNTDDDALFPTDGIHRVDEQMKQLYRLYGQEDHWDVFIGSGGHADTRELHVGTFPWMYRWLKGEELTEVAEAETYFSNEQLRVLDEIPADEINTSIDERFMPLAGEPPAPEDRRQWERMKAEWMSELRTKSFAGWPEDRAEAPVPSQVYHTEMGDYALRVFEYSPQEEVTLRLWNLGEDGKQPDRVLVRVLDEEGWQGWMGVLRAAAPEQLEAILGPGAKSVVWPEPTPAALEELRKTLVEQNASLVVVAPRGIGPTRFEADSPRGDTIRRSFPLLGQTRDGMRVWDVRQALIAIRSLPHLGGRPLQVEASGAMGGVVLYASLFDRPIEQLDLSNLPSQHHDGPYLLNVSQILDLPQVLTMARERSRVNLAD